jgi:hypothetical protein
MSFAIRYAGRDFSLGDGKFTIGRSEECHLCLDDPVASRHHARVEIRDGEVILEDLNSRNGVYLNEVRVQGQPVVRHGDKIRIGMHEMILIRRTSKGRAQTLIQRETTARVSSFGVLGGLAEKAIGMGRGDEAERIVGRQLEAIVEKAEHGELVPAEDFPKAVLFSMRIAELTRKSRWVTCLFRLYGARAQLMDAETVNFLYALGPKLLEPSSRPLLRDYLSVLSPMLESYDPGQRFVLKRLEGLEQVLR